MKPVPISLAHIKHRVESTLSLKMTLFYGALFVVTVALILAGARQGIERYAEILINREMTAASAVFDRVASLRYEQLKQGGRVLSGDFGFRTAAATGDAPTIISALDSLKHRQSLDNAFMVTIDGGFVGADIRLTPAERRRIWDALDSGAQQGIMHWGGRNHSLVAAPVEAPNLIGWVVFSNDFGAAQLQDIARLSSVDLSPRILPISALRGTVPVAKAGGGAHEMLIRGERMLVQAIPVQNFGSGEAQALVLEYSLTKAMAEYTPMLWMLLAFGVAGVILAVLGSWYLARTLTRPMAVLDDAARRVSSGEHVQVPVETSDELGRLAASFNRMVTDIEERERQIAHLAFHDSLTGLANRALLREHLSRVLESGGAPAGGTLFCLDLDNFKAVNDTLGHPTGDALLCEVAERLKAACPGSFVARLGGDEFALVAGHSGNGQSGNGHPGNGLGDRSPARQADEIISAIGRAFTVNGHRIVIGASIGIAIAPQDGDDAVALLKNADLALYRAKNEGKGNYRFFETAMDAEAQERRRVEVDLHDALGRGELELYFQPLFGLSQNRVTAFEALMRWNHPTRGLVSPINFIPLAEETGLIIPIGEWAIREACRVAAQWPEHIRVAVNISPVQFRSSALNRIILQALAESGLAPGRLELEITESLFIENVESTLSSLHSLRALGVRVALDDFGTGYSSLSYLRSFPFDKIKIDRSFIVDLLAHDGATAIIRSITTLAEALGMETTAEGVENVDQLDILRSQGCNQIQGYYFSKPLPKSEVDRLLGITVESVAADRAAAA